MSFLLQCPHCGARSVYEFRFGGEVKRRPAAGAGEEEWSLYLHAKTNASGEQTEWWFHRSGCRQWLQAERNTVTNEVRRTWFPEQEKR